MLARLDQIDVSLEGTYPFLENLSFFGQSGTIVSGQVVMVDMRGRAHLGVATSVVPLLGEKLRLKGLGFRLKALEAPTGRIILGASMLLLLENLASEYCVPLGDWISLSLPTEVRHLLKSGFTKRLDFAGSRHSETLRIEDSFPARLRLIQDLATTLRKGSLIVVVPSKEYSTLLGTSLGMEHSILVPGASKQTLLQALEKLRLGRQVLVCTPSFVPLILDQAEQVLIENYSGNYRRVRAPHLDARVFLTKLIERANIPLTIADEYIAI